jgi:hypothetical protein
MDHHLLQLMNRDRPLQHLNLQTHFQNYAQTSPFLVVLGITNSVQEDVKIGAVHLVGGFVGLFVELKVVVMLGQRQVLHFVVLVQLWKELVVQELELVLVLHSVEALV